MKTSRRAVVTGHSEKIIVLRDSVGSSLGMGLKTKVLLA